MGRRTGFLWGITFLIAAAFFLWTPMAQAVDVWKTANQLTVAWDQVTKMTDGSNVPAGNVIKYDIFIKPDGTTNSTKITANPVSTLTYTVTFSAEGRYDAGVQALRYDSANNLLSTSDISWSDVSGNCQGGTTFGAVFFQAPAAVKNLRSP